MAASAKKVPTQPARVGATARLLLPCSYCSEHGGGCHHHESQTAHTGRTTPGILGDCTEYHKTHRALRAVCGCGRSPCLPGLPVCVTCFDEEEMTADGLYGVGRFEADLVD